MKFHRSFWIDPADMLDLVQGRIDCVEFLEKSLPRKTKENCVFAVLEIEAMMLAKDLEEK